MNHVLQSILSLASITLGLKADELDPETNILELGLDSLMIIRLAQEIERRFGVSLEAKWFLTAMPSMADLSRRIMELRTTNAEPLPVSLALPENPVPELRSVPKPAQSGRPAPTSSNGLSALFAAQLETMQELFAQQLHALAPGRTAPAPQHAGASTPAGPVRLERNIRGFVLENAALSPEQDAFVRRLVATHTARTARSKEMGRRSAVLADWKSSLSFRPELRETAYPLVADETFGGRFRDVDGNEYIDIALGMGVHFLGHNPPYVVEALRNRLERGFGLGPQCDLTAQAAEGIARLTGMERVSFCNTGSEAVMFALRLARAKTNRPLVALFNGAYHGTFDGVLAASEERGTGSYSPGTPLGMVEDVLVLNYNSESAFAVLEERWQDVAAVLVEPVQSRKPDLQPQTFLRRLRRFTREKEICLIFDEMVNGFRCAPGGAQQHFSIRADLALYGKVAGGGLPVGIIAGKKEYLDYIDGGFLGEAQHPAADKTIVFGGTFCRHPLSMEGVKAATGHLLREGPALQDRVSRLADHLADRLNLWFQDNRVPLRLMHFGPQFLFEGFGPYSALAQPIELPLFYLLLMERGIYTWERRTCGLCTEHTEEDIRCIEEAVRDSVQTLRSAGFPFSLDKGAPNFFTPMSPTEERLYAIFQREHGQDAYHLPLAWKIREKEGRLDTELLEICLGQCIRRHEALRSSFHHIGGQLVRKVVDEPAFALELFDTSNGDARSAEELLRDFVRPFDLERAPLLRAGLATMADGSRLFMLDLLHLAADGASLGILLDDLNALMNGREPAVKAGSLREAQAVADPLRAGADTEYWTERLRELAPLELPLDFPARSGSPLGRQEWMSLDADLTASARRACRKFSVTLNMFLNGVYALLLHKLCGGTRFCVGMAEGGRHDEAMAGVMGMFVNTVPQDFTVRPEWTLPDFMAGVRAACVDSMEHNRAPYGDLVRAMGWSPAATMLSYEKADQRRPSWPGLEFTAMVPPGHGAMYDFALDIVEMDGVLHCNILSSEALRPETARCYGQCFAHLVAEAALAADTPATTVQGLSALPPAQAEKILHAWRGASVPFDPSRTVVDLFRHRSAIQPDANALVFRDRRLTYAELDRRSDALARHLASAGAGRENVVAILLDRGADFVVAALGTMKAGAAYLPLDPAAPTARLAFQLGDARPCALISAPAHRPPREHFSGSWIDARTLADLPDTTQLPNPPAPGPGDLAYIIYTSGTTGQPKGVMVEQRSLSSLCHWFTRHYAITHEDRTTAFAPFIFDASVWEIFPMLIQGATVHILDNDTRHDLPRLHEYLCRERITVAYFLSQVAEMVDGSALPDLRLLLSGGEVLRRSEAAGPYRHCNTYGPTEFTVTASSFDLDGTWPVPIGAPVDNAWALILDADGRPQPIGVPGELCLAGEQLARGYLNRPELTAAAFVPNPLAPADPAYGRMYRTGDLCRWLPDGNIEYLGRTDGQIKIRGHRVEPGEIEKTFLACAGVSQCAVMVRDDTGAQLLCAYVILEDDADAGSVRAFAAERLPAYMIPERVIVVEAIPVNASGKADKTALPAPTTDSGRPFAAPQTTEERLLAEIWAEQLHVEKIGRDDHFFELGGDSIKALMITSRVRAKGYMMETRDFFRDATIKALAPRLIPLRPAETTRRESDPVPETDQARIRALFGDAAEHVHGLAPLQHGIVFHGQLHPGSPAYIEQTLLAIHGPLNAENLGRRLDALTARHGMLRTAIIGRGVSRPWQVVLDRTWLGEMPLHEEDLRDLNKNGQQQRIHACMDAERARGFDLERPPLIRFCLLRTGEADHALLCTAHHVIVDGWSMGVLFSEFFGTQDFGPRPAQFHDYVAWLRGQDREKALAWWQRQLDGAEPSELPGHRPSMDEYRGQRLPLTLPSGLENRLRELAGRTRLTMNVILQTAWGLVLSRCTLRPDVVFGEVVSGRPAELPGVENLIGLCSNTVPVRMHCDPLTSFNRLAANVQDTALAARQHAHCSLAEIQTAAGLGQDLLTHFFVLENYPPPQGGQDLTITIMDEFSQTDFDFAVVWEQREGLSGSLVYNAACFEPWRMESLGEAYLTVLDAISRATDEPISSISLVSERVRRTLLDEFRAPVVTYPSATVVELFRRTVARQPEHPALIFRNERLTYAELDRRSDALARRLRAAGAGPEGIVAVLLHRGLSFGLSLLAVLKAGGAFLPLAADAPVQRLRFQLEDSGAMAVIGETALLADLGTSLPCFDVLGSDLFRDAGDSPLSSPSPTDLAYVIYTSGTTGLPKGAPVEHRSLTNQTLWTARHYGLSPESRLTLFAAHAFDVSIWEFFPGLAAGATLHVLGDDLRQDLNALDRYLRAEAITDAWLPPHMAALFLSGRHGEGLRTLTAGGDVFRPQGTYPFTLFNNYGPTECAITSTSCRDFAKAPPLSIGKPVDNTDAYILDQHGHLQPVGVAGELCITGVQVARGYLNRPELTAAAFVPNPRATGPDTARMYRTGDLCRWLPGGSIEFLGRLDQQVKIRGHRIEPGEIEKTIQSCPQVAQCVVRANEGRLCAYVVAKPGSELGETAVRAVAAGRLPSYMVPDHVVFLDGLPLTSSGKIDTKALPAPQLLRTDFTPPRTPAEKDLCVVLAEVLEQEAVGLNDDFFQLGGDSIKALMVASRLWARGLKLELKDLYARASLSALAAGMTSIDAPKADARWSDPAVTKDVMFAIRELLAPAQIARACRLTPMQEAMFEACDANPDAYLVENWAEILGELDPDALEKRLHALTERHEALRAVFVTVENRPWQAVLERKDSFFAFEDLSTLPAPEQDQRMRAAHAALPRPRLIGDPLVRLLLFRLGEDRFRVLLSWHHIILDGWSLGRLLSELFAPELPASPAVSFLEHVRVLAGGDTAADLEWWREALRERGAPALLPRTHAPKRLPETQSCGQLTFAPTRHTDQKLRALAASRRLTLNNLLQAVWALVLSRHADQDEVIFGSVVSGRPTSLPGVEELVGLCVTTVPVRVDCTVEISFARTAEAVQAWNVAAEEHAFCPLAELKNLAGEGMGQLFVFENQPPLNPQGLTITPLRSAGYAGVDFALEWTDSGRLSCTFHYDTSLFEEWRIQALRDHYLVLLEAAVLAPDAPQMSLPMLTPAEERRILVHCNQTPELDTSRTVVDLFRDTAAQWPQRTALVCEDASLTYARLDLLTDSLAARLAAHGAGPEQIVGLLLPRRAEFVQAALAVMKAGAAYLPLDPEWPAERLHFVLRDAGVRLLVDCPEHRHLAPEFGGPRLDAYAAESAPKTAPEVIPAAPRPDQLAYVIYTSGSTGQPKGVLLEHRGLTNLCRWQHASFPLTEDDVCTAYAPWSFDASVYEIFPALTGGATLHILPEELRLDTEGLRAFFLERRVSVAFLPPLVGHQVLDDHEFPALRVVTVAGDKPGALAPRPFCLRNCYGPTEFTVCATCWPVTARRADPPIGTPIAGARCHVLGRHGQLQPFGVAGELCVSGVQTARGYLNRPEQTARAFVPNPFAPDEDGPHARMYRTGDLCRLMPDGNLEFVGRMDGQLKLRGRRLEPGEIESALLAHPDVTSAVTVLREGGELQAYVVCARKTDTAELTAWLRDRLPQWMVPQAIITLDAMPLTANGKVDRDALPRPEARTPGSSLPATPQEKALAEAWTAVLGTRAPGLTDNFFALGGDSIKAMLVVSRLRAAGYALTSRILFQNPILAAAAAQLRLPDGTPSARSTGGRKPEGRDLSLLEARFGSRIASVHCLTPMQEGLLFHHTVEPAAYIEQSRLDLDGPLDADALARRLGRAVRRHSILRTVFAWKGLTRPWQIVLREADHSLIREDLQALSESAQAGRMNELLAEVRTRSLDLESGPLLTLTLCALGPDRHALLVSFHHIILDGWSLGILARELFSPDSFGPNVPDSDESSPAIPFSRYVDWIEAQDTAAHRAFWREHLDGAKATAIPGRRASTERAYDGRDLPLRFGQDLSDRLADLAARCQVTVNTLIQAAWAVVLGRATNSSDVIFGTVLSGRGVDLDGVADMVGMFVNTVPMRIRLTFEQPFSRILTQIQDLALALEPHAHLPLAEIQRLSPLGGALIGHLLVFENLPPMETDADLRVSPAGGFNRTNYDLSLVFDHGAQLTGRMQYNAAALEPWLVEALGRHLTSVLRQVADNADIREADILLDAPEEIRPPHEPVSTTVVDMFRASAARHAQSTALVCGERTCTYAELDSRTQDLAHALLRLGAGPENIVAVLLSRSAEQIVSQLGILRAGAAYLVLDPAHPDERLRALLNDAVPCVLIFEESLSDRVRDFGGATLDINAPLPRTSAPLPVPAPRSLAYLVYTSGTTGQPKGVMIEQRSLANFCAWHVRHYEVTPEDRSAHAFSFAFDASAWGIFPLLAAGGCVHVLDDATRMDPLLMRDYFDRHGITMANIPTVLVEQFQTLVPPRGLRLLATGGDALRSHRPQPYALYNEYGPSEATIMATCQRVQDMDGPIPIGLPVAGTRCLILDVHDNRQPVGLPGELHLAGAALARGYLNQPEQTAAAFVPNPFAAAGDPDDARLYRTGDLCRRLPDGALEFLGRIDDQLSIRGFRIEPAEIEQALLAHPAVRAVTVQALPDSAGDPMLCAYVVADAWDEENVQAHARRTLPAHMVPAMFIRLDALPLTTNGKIDRAALPRPSRPGRTGATPPVTALELALTRIWQDVLDMDGIGLDDDFFRLGGDSLKAVRLAARLESALGCAMTTAELMGGVTIHSLTHRIESGDGGWRPLVTLREGSGLPLVLVHAVGGSVLCYRDLVDALPKDRPVFVLPAYGLDDGQEPDTRLEDLAARYVPSLAGRFPNGDFLLLGLCMAGMTAWELARQLLEAGCPVRGVVSLNTRSRLLVDDLGRPLAADEIPTEVPEEAIALGVRTMSGYDGQTPADNGNLKLRAMLRAQLLAWARYAPRPLPLPMTCVRPSDPVDGTYLPFETRPLGWDGLALGGAEERYCPGNHFSMLKAPHVRDMAALLEEVAHVRKTEEPDAQTGAPLTPIQRWFLGLDMNHGQFFQSVVLRSDRARAPEIYEAALAALAARHEMLRAAYTLSGGEYAQRIRPHGAGFGFRTCAAGELEATATQLVRATDLERGPLAWAVLAPEDGKGDLLALLIHHLVVDGVSWRILQQDFTSALRCLDQGLPVELPSAVLAEDGSFPLWARRLAEHAKSPAVLGQAPFWRSMLTGRPGPMPSDAPVNMRRKADLTARSTSLDEKATRLLLGPCNKALGTEINDLLLGALVLAMREWRGIDAVTVDLEGHGRQDIFPDLLPGAIVGWFTTVHPVVLTAGADACATIDGARRILASVPDKGLGFGLLRHVSGLKDLGDYEADVLFNYLGDASGTGEGPLRLERIGLPGDVGPNYPQQAKLAVTGLVSEGCLQLTVEWHQEEFRSESLEDLMRALERQLRAVIGCCMNEEVA